LGGLFVCNLQPQPDWVGFVFCKAAAKRQRDLREGGGDRWFDEVLVIEVKQCDAVGRDREACDKVENADAFVPERPAVHGHIHREAPPLWRQLTVLQLWLRKA
jgi:hypothetical protein